MWSLGNTRYAIARPSPCVHEFQLSSKPGLTISLLEPGIGDACAKAAAITKAAVAAIHLITLIFMPFVLLISNTFPRANSKPELFNTDNQPPRRPHNTADSSGSVFAARNEQVVSRPVLKKRRANEPTHRFACVTDSGIKIDTSG